jgi:transposase
VAGANASANLYSLVQTCKANGIDSYRYLRALFIALPNAKTVDDCEELLPWRIALPAQ